MPGLIPNMVQKIIREIRKALRNKRLDGSRVILVHLLGHSRLSCPRKRVG